MPIVPIRRWQIHQEPSTATPGSLLFSVTSRAPQRGIPRKVGRFVSDSKAGAYCQIALECGEKILVNHDKAGFKGGAGVTISQVNCLGLGDETVFQCDLESAAGKAAMAGLTTGLDPESVGATPLGAFVEHGQACGDFAAVKSKAAGLVGPTGAGQHVRAPVPRSSGKFTKPGAVPRAGLLVFRAVGRGA